MPRLLFVLSLPLLLILSGCLPGRMNWSSTATANRSSGEVPEATGNDGEDTDLPAQHESESGNEGNDDDAGLLAGQSLSPKRTHFGLVSREGMTVTQLRETGAGIASLPDGRTAIGMTIRSSDGVMSQCAVMFLSPEGNADTSFGNGYPGVVVLSLPSVSKCQVNTIALQGSNILVGGWAERQDGKNLFVGRVRPILPNAGGFEQDSLFGEPTSPGFVFRKPGNLYAEAKSFAVRPNGEIIVAGNALNLGIGAFLVVGKLSSLGLPVSSFDSTGFRVQNLVPGNSDCWATTNAVLVDETNVNGPIIYVAADLYAGGTAGVLASFTIDGALYFRDPGAVQTFTGTNQQIAAMAFYTDGGTREILITGRKSLTLESPSYVSRLAPETGLIDPSFNLGSHTLEVSGSTATAPVGIGIANGKIYIPARYYNTGVPCSAVFSVGTDGSDLTVDAFSMHENPLASFISSTGLVLMTGTVPDGDTDVLFRRQVY